MHEASKLIGKLGTRIDCNPIVSFVDLKVLLVQGMNEPSMNESSMVSEANTTFDDTLATIISPTKEESARATASALSGGGSSLFGSADVLKPAQGRRANESEGVAGGSSLFGSADVLKPAQGRRANESQDVAAKTIVDPRLAATPSTLAPLSSSNALPSLGAGRPTPLGRAGLPSLHQTAPSSLSQGGLPSLHQTAPSSLSQGTQSSRSNIAPLFQNGTKSGFEMCVGPSTLGAGAKTRLESGLKKFTPHCICR